MKELSGEIVIIGREMHPDGTTCDKFAKLLLFNTCANRTYKYICVVMVVEFHIGAVEIR